MTRKRNRADFDHLMLPHLDDAYGLARWLLGHQHDAEDAVQQSYLKAFKAFDQYLGNGGNAWILKIVRNTCMTMLRKRASGKNIVSIDLLREGREQHTLAETLPDPHRTPESSLLDHETQKIIWKNVHALSVEFREIIVLREFLELSYLEISEIAGVPVGTVMSRLSRARQQLRKLLSSFHEEHRKHEL